MKVWFAKISIGFSLCVVSGQVASANSNYVGTITRSSGDVNILSKPSDQANGPGPWVKFEDKYYKVKKAKVGTKLQNSNVVQSFSNGKAMIVFPNGDHIHVGPGTSYQMNWQEGSQQQSNVLKMVYGNVRGVVSPQGPRKNMKVETKTAVAGVRGTDFSIQAVGGTTELHVLRGKVEIQEKSPQSAPVAVEAGYTGKIAQSTSSEPDTSPQKDQTTASSIAVPLVQKTTKEELIVIQKASSISKDEAQVTEPVDSVVKEEIQKLESQAKVNLIADIKTYDPEQGAKLEQLAAKAPLDLQEINTTSVSKLFKEAPAQDKSKAFSAEDFEGIDGDVYNKYFRDGL